MRNFSLIFDTNRCEQQIEFPRKNIWKQYRFCIRSVNVSLTWRETISTRIYCKSFTKYNRTTNVKLTSPYQIFHNNFTMYNKPRDVNLRSEYDEGILPIWHAVHGHPDLEKNATYAIMVIKGNKHRRLALRYGHNITCTNYTLKCE